MVVAGANGSGKSSFIEYILLNLIEKHIPNIDFEYVNADKWQLEQYGEYHNETDDDAISAQAWANQRRSELMREGKSFITETVFSHESKVELIQAMCAANYQVILFHIFVNKPEIAVNRVKNRVAEGGHHVPKDKIINRYHRCNKLIAKASKLACVSDTLVYDNTSPKNPFSLVYFKNNKNGLFDKKVRFYTQTLSHNEQILELYN